MSSSFRLLMTTDTSHELWNYTITLCKALSLQMQIEVFLVCTGNNPQEFHKQQALEAGYQIIFTNRATDWNNDIQEYLENSYDLEKHILNIISEFKPHMLHLSHYTGKNLKGKLPIILAANEDVLNCVRWVDRRGRSLPIEPEYSRYRGHVQKVLNAADVIVAPSRFFAESLYKTYGFSSAVKVIYNSIETEPEKEFNNSPVIITSAKSCNRQSNLNLLFKIASKIPESLSFYVLDKNKNDVRKPGKIEFIDSSNAEQINDLYKKSSIFLALTPWDVLATSSIRAAFSNCAIIANDVPLFRELWGDCACIFERNDANSLIRCINNLTENENLLNLTAKRCQNKALSTFSTKRMALEYMNVYKKVLQKQVLSEKKTEIEEKIANGNIV